MPALVRPHCTWHSSFACGCIARISKGLRGDRNLKAWMCSALRTVSALGVTLALGAVAFAQGATRAPVPQRPIPPLQAPITGFEFPQHQVLTFTVDWRVFTAGIAVFHLDQVGDVLKISATADTIGAINMLFPVVDRFQSSFNMQTGCSHGFNKQTQEGRRKLASELMFDYPKGRQTQNERNLVKGTATHKDANIPACVTDSLSAIFYTQTQPLNVGQTMYFPLADSMRTVTVGMKVESKEEIKTPAGTFQTSKCKRPPMRAW